MKTISETYSTEREDLQQLLNSQMNSFVGDLSDLKGFLNDAVTDKLFNLINDKKGMNWTQNEFDLIIYNFNNLNNILDNQIKISNANNKL
jgi:hypothetical protein